MTAVLYDELGLFVGKIVECLQHQYLEHKNQWKSRLSALRSVRPLQCLRQPFLKHRPRNNAVELLQRITGSTQPLVTIVQIPETKLSPHHPLPANHAVRLNHEFRKRGRFFRGVELSPD
jgi:hypothetical protein